MPKLVIFAIAIVPLLTLAVLLAVLFWPQICAAFRRPVDAPWRRLSVVLVALVVALAPGLALAQGAGVAAGADPGSPWLGIVISVVSAAFLAFAGWILHRYLGITLDRQAQDSLHRAMMTGATIVAARFGVRSAALDASAPDMVLDYVHRSVPDALDRLLPGKDVLTGMARAKLLVAGAGGQIPPVGQN